MASGKRASMREGPLADLFRQTEEPSEDKKRPRKDEAPREAGHPSAEQRRAQAAGTRKRPAPEPRPELLRDESPSRATPEAEPAREPERRPATSRYEGVPTPEERLRSVFSSDIPENIMERAPEVRRGACPGAGGVHRPQRR